MNPSWLHLCDNPDMMYRLGITSQSGENHMSLVTDVTCKENLVRHVTRYGDLLVYPVTVVTDGPMTAAHHIMRVWDTDDEGDMRYLIGYVRIDWHANSVTFHRTWGGKEVEVSTSPRTSVMNKLRVVLQYMAYDGYLASERIHRPLPYHALNVPSFTGVGS